MLSRFLGVWLLGRGGRPLYLGVSFRRTFLVRNIILKGWGIVDKSSFVGDCRCTCKQI